MTYESSFWATEGEVIPEVAIFKEEGLVFFCNFVNSTQPSRPEKVPSQVKLSQAEMGHFNFGA